MIYLKNNQEAQTAILPRRGALTPSRADELHLYSAEGKERAVLGVNIELTELYVVLSITLPEGLADGEYRYRLLAGDVVAGSGLAKIGTLESGMRQGDETIEYNQYEED